MSQDEVCIKTRQDKKDNFKQNRRSFIKTAALAGGATLITGVPLASYFIAPSLNKGVGKWVDFGAAEDLEPDSVAM